MTLQRLLMGLILTAILALAGCGEDGPSNIESQHLRAVLFDNPTNLDPRTYADAVSFRVIEQVYDYLVRMDSTGFPKLQLAEKLETPDDKTYIFTIRKGVKFHDGSPLSAHDVAYTFQSIKNPELNAPLRSTLEIVESIEVLDSLRVKFSLKNAYAPILADLEVGIVPKKVVESGADLKLKPIGSGPFMFKEWSNDAFLRLTANPHYWRGVPPLKELELKILPEATTQVLALENREVDFLLNNFPESHLPRFEKNERLKIKKSPGSNYVYLGLNQENQYLSNKKVRKALAHAINFQSMVQNLFSGLHRSANSVLNKQHWAYNPSLKDYGFDPEKARRLLDEAGFSDPDQDGPKARFKLVYKCTDKLASRQKAQVVQQQLKDVGIDVEIKSFEWGTFFDDIKKGRFDLFSLSIVGVYEPAVYEHFFHSKSIGTSKNRIGYRNAEVDELIDRGKTAIDIEERKKYYHRIQEILQDELPVISMWHETNVAVMDKRLEGFEIYPAAEWKALYKMQFATAAP